MEQILILDKHDVGRLVFDSGKFNPGTPAIGCLFGGDRFSCIDEAVCLEVDGNPEYAAELCDEVYTVGSWDPTAVALVALKAAQ